MRSNTLESTLLECKDLVDKIEVAVYKTEFLPEDEHIIEEELRQLSELYRKNKIIIIHDEFIDYHIEVRLETIKELVPKYLSEKIMNLLGDMTKYRESYNQEPQIVSQIENDSSKADSSLDF